MPQLSGDAWRAVHPLATRGRPRISTGMRSGEPWTLEKARRSNRSCNKALGLFGDDPSRMVIAAKYLSQELEIS